MLCECADVMRQEADRARRPLFQGGPICDGANSFTMRTSLASRGTSAMLKPVFNATAFMGSLARNISAVRRRAPRLLARHSISAVSSVPIPLPRQSSATESANSHSSRSGVNAWRASPITIDTAPTPVSATSARSYLRSRWVTRSSSAGGNSCSAPKNRL